jgi:2,3-diphosphopglycerate-independent phosphoglycerate mutase
MADRQFVLIIPDGAADVARVDGRSPLGTARMEFADAIAHRGISGLMRTLYDDLPRGSVVAQLGMLGWDPYRYFPHGRASAELLALDGSCLHEGDLAFRANLVRMQGRRLESYNAGYIPSVEAARLVDEIQAATAGRFAGFELHHNSDFRNTLVVRGAGVDPRLLACPEPHESEGREFDPAALVAGTDAASRDLARVIDDYLVAAAEVLAGRRANMLFPWSPSGPLALPRFADHTGFRGRVGVVAAMHFLEGIARAGGLDFVKVGDGSPDTDYQGKGAQTVALLASGYSFVICHVNAPDEASHMGDRALKVRCLESIDREVIGPVLRYFDDHPERLGGVMVAPDHYTNLLRAQRAPRSESHSTHPVPFALWNGRDRDQVDSFGEDAAGRGRFGAPPISHLDLLVVLGLPRQDGARGTAFSFAGNGRPEPRPDRAAVLTRQELLGLDPAERRPRLERHLGEQVAHVARVAGGGARRLDVHRPLAAVGLDSLAAVELGQALESDFRLACSLPELLGEETVASLATRILAGLEPATAALPPPCAPAGAAAAASYALSYGQRSLWLMQQMAPASGQLNLSLAAWIVSPFDPAALDRAFQLLAGRHDALRARFEAPGGEPIQRIQAVGEVPFALVAAETWTEEQLRRRAAEQAWRPFDLAREPPLRAALFRRGERAHLLVATAHHIAVDFWSVVLLARDLARLYAAAVMGTEAAAPAAGLSLDEYVRWQAELLDGAAGERSWRFWQRRLGGELPRLELPADRPRRPGPATRGAALGLRLDAVLGMRLRALAQSHGATLYVLLLAAWKALLARACGGSDLLVGSPAAGRGNPRFSGLVGYLMNPLPLRTDLAGDPGLPELLGRVRCTVLAALEHQDFPAHLIAERLAAGRGASQGAMYRTLFVFNRSHDADLDRLALAALELPGVRLRLGMLEVESCLLDDPPPPAGCDLQLMMAESSGSIAAALRYDADLFDATTVQRLAGQLQRLLAGWIEQPQGHLSTLPLLSAGERHQLLVEWSAGPPPAAAADRVHRRISAQAARTPQAPAVVAGGTVLTYRDLERRSRRLAHRLRGMGVRPEVRVGVLLERSPTAIVTLLGVLRAGGAYVPIDPASPRERIALVLADSGAEALLTEERLRGRLPETAARVLCLDAELLDPGAGAEGPPGEVDGGATAENLAYVIYTSGSTGGPKGVLVRHRSLAEYSEAAATAFGLGPGDRVLQFASLSFDTSAEEIYPCLCRGAALVLRDEPMLRSIADFLAACRERGITVLDLPTAFWHELAAALAAPGSGLALPPALRLVVIGGERAAPSMLAAWQSAARGTLRRVRLLNTYGPTEATIVATQADLAGEEDAAAAGREVAIGRAVGGARVHLLDVRGELVPAGSPGEICLAGAGLARGYLGRPALTAERFVPDAFSGQPGERLYRTGDLGRHRGDGSLEFLGRTDQQLKIRGFRVEPGEVEALLASHPRVRAAAVAGRADGGELRLAAWVAADQDLGASELAALCRSRLPAYMVPAAFVVLRELPRTAAGKIDRAALPAPDSEHAADRGSFVAPRTPVEEVVEGVCAEVLGRERVSVEDDLFALGCHSLLAMKIVARLREALAVELPLLDLFAAPTVRQLAAAVAAAGQAPAEALPPIARVPRDGDLPLSFAQERIWFLTQLNPELRSYYVPRALRIRGRFAPPGVAAAFDEIVRRHEILRTTFPARDGRPVQSVGPPWRVAIPLVDLRGLAAPARQAEMRRLVLAEGRRAFDLERGPLLRLTLLRLEAEEHVLQMTEHHLVHDGWTQGVLLRDFLAIYGAFRQGRPSPLPELPVQYADFACWQRRWLRDEVLERQLAYWRQKLAGAPATLALPFDRPRPAVQTFSGAQQTWVLPAALCRGLRAASRRLGATLFMTMASAFDALLLRCGAQDDLCVGTGVANRRVIEVEGLLGMLINTLVLRGDLSGDPSFAALVGRMRQVCVEAYAHQDLPFERLVAALQVDRTLSQTPIFQVFFAFMDTPMPDLALPGLELAVVDAHNRSAKFDLNMTVLLPSEQRIGIGLGAGSDEITLLLEYSTDVFDPPTIGRLLGHFEVLLAAAATGADRRLSQLALLAAAERHQLLAEWNPAGAAAADDPCVHELCAARAAGSPDACAVSCGPLWLSWRELERRAHRLARALAARGVRPGDRVGLCVERSPAMVAALLGILESGAAYVPLDPALPVARLAFIAADARLAAVVADASSVAALDPVSRGRALLLDGGREAPAGAGDATPAPRVDPGAAAYVIYTSGSTGQPKGVTVPHRALANFLRSMRARPGLGAGDVLLAVTTLSFDIAALELLLPLTAGARVEVASRETAADARALAAALASGVTAMQATPATWRMLLEGGWQGDRRLRALCGGEALPRELADRLLERCGELWNLYGPTETTVWSAVERLAPGGGPIGLGKPVAGTCIHLLDAALELVPVGVPGELHIAGDGLALGYWARPELTAAAFLPDPFGAAPGARLYRTGDLARRHPDGTLEFLGRRDHQVKVHGFRIELGEIESALERLPAVRQAVVVARQEPPEPARLVAYLVPASDEVPEVEELRRRLGETLPGYMLPAAVVWLAALPLTASGKVDRRALPRPSFERPGLSGRLVAPRTEIERIIAGIWQEVLEIGEVGIHDSFFNLGGHSLLATRVLSRVRRQLGVELPLRTLFATPTVAALGAAVAARLGAGEARPAPPITPVERSGELPLSFAQQRLWFLAQLEPESPAYHIAQGVRVEGRLQVGALSWALGELVRRHEALRTTFVAAAGEPVQRIGPPAGVALPVVDLAGLGAERRRALAEKLARAAAARTFDLARGPLLRWLLLRLRPDDHLAVLVLHHIVGDHWSMGVLVRETAALYAARLRAEPSPLPPLPVQYADFAVWQRRWLAGETLARELAFWRRSLLGAPPRLALPTDRPLPPVRRWRAATLPFAVPEPLARRLAELSRREDVTLFMCLLAGLQILLARYGDQERVDIGTPIAGRHHLETEGLIGLLVNTLVLAGDLAREPAVGELLSRVRETTLAAYAHQELPFERLVEELQPQRSLASTPLFQVMLTLHNAPRARLEAPGLTLELCELVPQAAKFDLGLAVEPVAAGLRGRLVYDAELFDRATAGRLLGHWRNLLGSLAAAGRDQPVAELPWLEPAERAQLLWEWNDTRPAAPRPRLVHELLELHARLTPDKPALVESERWLSYGELNRLANRLARRLRGLGVGPERVVGLGAERSAGLVIGLLAVLKAGGAYVPLDPAWPRQRLARVLAATAARWVLAGPALAGPLAELPRGPALLRLDDELAGARAADGGADLGLPLAPQSLAYVIFTSGSTGGPKGVAVEQRQLAAYVHGVVERLDLASDASFALASTPAADLGYTTLFSAPATGGCLHLLPHPTATDGGRFGRYLDEHAIDCLKITPSHLRALQAEDRSGRGLPRRRLVLGGEAVEPRELEQWRRRAPACWIFNHYGPTESTVGVLTHRLEAAVADRPVPLGRPLPGAAVYVLDRRQRPLPAGVAGELAIGGAGVARCYFGRPELTAERFIPDPFGPPGARLYRSGDLARRRPDGVVEFLGRIDRQVKIRGYRVEPAEVAAALARHGAVREAVVAARGEGPERRLVAYLVAAAEPVPATAEIRAFLARHLPDFMLPAAVVWLEAMPLNANGKVDLEALPAPEAAPSAPAGEGPRGPLEELLAAIWCELLGKSRVGMDDDFFALGGHSLLATQLVSRVRQALGVELSLRRLFEVPTMAGLASAIAAARAGGGGPQSPPITALPRPARLPLSFAQERLWFLDQLDPGRATYNLPYFVRLRGPLSVAALAAALLGVVRRHETLRTRIAIAAGEAVQVVGPADSLQLVRLAVVELSALPLDRREEEAGRLAVAEAARTFDLLGERLFRALLLATAERDHTLLLTLHHVISDAWSRGVLAGELAALYTAAVGGRPSALAALPCQYADFAVWQRQWLQGQVLAAELAFWRERLGEVDAGAPALPTDRAPSPLRGTRGGQLRQLLPQPLAAALETLARRQRVTLYMLLFGAFATVLYRCSERRAVVIGSLIANRHRREVEGLIGFFVNLLALRLDFAGAPGARELLARARRVTLEAYEHQDLPFEKLVEGLSGRQPRSRTPWLGVVLQLHNAPMPALALPGIEGEALPVHNGTVKFDLTLSVSVGERGWTSALEYDRDLFDPATARRLVGHFHALLAALSEVGAGDERPVAELPMLSAGERAQLLVEWNDTAAGYPRDAVIHQLFARQAALRPEAPALVFDDEEVSYGELDRRANRLAHRLRALGVGPEVPVAFAMGRSTEAVVAMLAILKAGGAYLPLDPGHPPERLRFMLADSQAPVLVAGGPPPSEPPGVRVLRLDLEGEAIARCPDVDPAGPVEPCGLAYMMYTSGSTGRPKGVCISHRAVCRLLFNTNYLGLERGLRLAQAANLAFDAATFEIWGALLHGGCLAGLSHGRPLTAAELARLAGGRRLDALYLTCPLFNQLAAEADDAFAAVGDLLFGGEAADVRWVRKALGGEGPARLLHVYGPTEATTFASFEAIAELAPGASAVAIGRPLANTDLYVVDGRCEPVGIGVPGELLIGGDGLARGYWRQPALTAERFVPDPFSGRPGAVLYRSGDRVSWRADGRLEFLGRLDSQVKVRGFRVEPAEIEAALAEHPEVARALVVAREDPHLGRHLVAYLVAGQPVPHRELRRFLRERLPEYMVPAFFVELEAVPLNANGKVDFAALPAPDGAAGEGTAPEPPASPTARRLATIWTQILGRDRVGVDEDFFGLGGHSLLATRVLTRVQEVFKVQVPLRRFWEAPTIAELEAEITWRQVEAAGEEEVARLLAEVERS